MSTGRDAVREILLDVADNIRREPNLLDRAAQVDEFIVVALRLAQDLRDSTCFDLMEDKVSRNSTAGLPAWVERRHRYAHRWATKHGLPHAWQPGPARLTGPEDYVDIALPD